ncbi:zinc-binding dehydrogenase [Hyphomicrobiales bacterium BP6-180914]|uniref:Zinc-binding dehydrogenase n=1 Tax=Lichenifustis flavocetrariae TaxID=2949735 RepID=A0AA41YTA4_9HYPH|nr:zinc-binding dehydrogenase [Lichenifustis flavocetrariae]MCW6506418.1 zinc-binding dehydrogenase [Lichenifustis flavocetrariae]
MVTSRSSEKLERAKALGATAVIDTSANPNWSVAALELTGGRGVDHVLEIIGGDNVSQSAATLASAGRIAQIGFLKEPEIILPAVPIMLKRAIIRGISVGHRRAFENMNRAIDEYRIKPVVDKVYAFKDAHAAFDHLERGPFGKIVVRLSNEVGN